MANEREKWENIEELGSGGQGKVFLVRRPAAAEARAEALKRIEAVLMSAGGGLVTDRVSALAQDILLCGRQDDLQDVAALKEFKVDGDDKEQAINRLKAEIKALSHIQHPSILKYIDSSVDERFLVTQYYPGRSLHKKPTTFKGDPLSSLKALRSLVEAVKLIHDNGAIHRDIKPENIFLAETGDLVLGDFGIVIFRDHDRLTATYERAGTRYWMAPWVDRKERIELAKVDATLDIYPLGKLLWFMIAGRDIFSRENFEDHEYNLELMFLDKPREMRKINEFLKKCVVDRRDKCLPNAEAMLSEIDGLEIVLAGKREGNIKKWPCRVCVMGEYESQHTQATHDRASVPVIVQSHPKGYSTDPKYHLHVFACNHCGNVELFMAR